MSNGVGTAIEVGKQFNVLHGVLAGESEFNDEAGLSRENGIAGCMYGGFHNGRCACLSYIECIASVIGEGIDIHSIIVRRNR